MSRVLIIGIDGATFDVILPLVKRGKLPTFKKLMENGSYGILKSTIPYVTSPAWSSAVTGVNPGKHDIYQFGTFHGYHWKVNNASDRKREAFWKLASKYGKNVIVLNVPLTYPPEDINGYMVSGFLTPSIKNEFSYPKELKKEILEKFPNFKFMTLNPTIASLEDVKKDIIDTLKVKFEISKYLMKKIDWDIFMTVFMASDQIQHFFWNKKPVEEVYIKLDGMIKELIGICDRETTVIIMSDHGFTKIKNFIDIEELHENLGLYADGYESLHRKFFLKIGITKHRIYEFLMKIGISSTKFIPSKIKNLVPSSDFSDFKYPYEKMKAFYCNWGLRINLKGRESNGIIEKNDYEALRKELIKKSKDLKDPETHEKIFKRVFKREEIYEGEYLENASDIIFLPNDGYIFTSEIKKGWFPSKEVEVATHNIDGIIMIYGKHINNKKVKTNILDVTPTILYIMGVPLPKDLDGRVLNEIFRKDSEILKKEIRYENYKEKVSKSFEFSEEDQEKVLKRLKGLGYTD